jgi:hypothetical protein
MINLQTSWAIDRANSVAETYRINLLQEGECNLVENERVTGLGVTIGLCIGSLIMAGGYGLPQLAAELPLYPKEASIWGISIGTATLAIAVAGAIMAVLSYQMNRGVSRSSRFKDAVNLLAQGTPVTAMAGIAVIEQVSQEDVTNYAWPAVETLNYYYQVAEPESSKISYLKGVMPTYSTRLPSADWPDSDGIGLNAIFTAARLSNIFRRVANFRARLADDRYLISKAYIGGIIVSGITLQNCWIQHGVLNHTHFKGCDFRNCRIDVVVGSGVKFLNCDLTNAQLWFHRPDGHPMLLEERRVSFDNCQGFEGAKTFDSEPDEYRHRIAAFDRAQRGI